ncbi:hypothetical protein RDI58_003884 [Solanum bulbocastanum]|uniref:Uncharacterized protein n=1 Tax=Solanum bulbocastanum TaxID=147425 RepID=A0AAN8YPD9_SOLBU
MGKEDTSRQNKKAKGKQYVLAGTLTSMAYKKVASLRLRENVQSILPRNSSTLVAQTLQEEVRQVPWNSSTLKAQSKKDQMQKKPQSSSTLKAKSMQESEQQVIEKQVVEKHLQHVPRE